MGYCMSLADSDDSYCDYHLNLSGGGLAKRTMLRHRMLDLHHNEPSYPGRDADDAAIQAWLHFTPDDPEGVCHWKIGGSNDHWLITEDELQVALLAYWEGGALDTDPDWFTDFVAFLEDGWRRGGIIQG